MLGSLSLRTRLLAICTVLAMLILVVGSIGFYSISTISKKYEHVALTNLPNSVSLGRMRFFASEMTRFYLRLNVDNQEKSYYTDLISKIDSAVKSYEVADKAYTEIPFVEGEGVLYDHANTVWKEFQTKTQVLVKSFNVENPKENSRYEALLNEASFRNIKTAHNEALTKLIEFQGVEASKMVKDAQETSAFAKTSSGVLVVGGFFFSLILGWFFSRSLAAALRTVTTSIADSSSQVSTASEQLSSASQQLSSGASEAASSLEETVASVEELSSMVKLNADNAKEAASLSQTSRQSAEEGEAEIRKLNEAMGEIAKSSKKIEEIINVIDDIAFQTNLLALNAAVEAARAGEQGKGFAVVAEAVRTLAQRSAAAAKDITTLIQDSVAKIDRGTSVADEGARALKSIVVTVKKVAELNNEIASASQEQSNGLAQISKAMNELDQATQRNAASAEETAAASEEMSSQSVVLQDMVATLTGVLDGRSSQDAPMPVMAQTQRPQARRPAPVLRMASRASRAKPSRSGSSHTSAAADVIPFHDEQPLGKVGTTDGF